MPLDSRKSLDSVSLHLAKDLMVSMGSSGILVSLLNLSGRVPSIKNCCTIFNIFLTALLSRLMHTHLPFFILHVRIECIFRNFPSTGKYRFSHLVSAL